jgi:hypothetical protein
MFSPFRGDFPKKGIKKEGADPLSENRPLK